MHKLISAAVIGGAALAVGVLPAASIASAAIAPPTPIQTPVAAPPSAPVTPGGTHRTPVHHAPAHHRKPGHRSGKRKPGKGSTHAPGTHRSPGGSHKPSGGAPGSAMPGSHKPVGVPSRPHKPVGAPTGSHKPVGVPGGKHKPGGSRQPGGKPVGKPPVLAKPRIIGGGNATDAPWAAQVDWADVGFQCSGSVIAPQWVLTAGHCVGDGAMTVRVGSLRLGGGTEVDVDGTQVDPKGDLALLHLADPVQTTFAKLADADPQVGAQDQIFGWGKTGQDSGPAKRLRVATVKVTDVTNCVDGKQGKAICSEGVDGYAFNGDSGGPEMSGGVQVGVCSTGNDQEHSQQYASVAASRTWLKQTAGV